MAAPDYDCYKKIKLLGEGAFGKAILVEDIRDTLYYLIYFQHLMGYEIN